MRRLWFAIYLLSASWLFAVDFYEPARPLVCATFVAAGSLMAALVFHSAGASATRSVALVFLGPATLASVLVPYPFNVGFVVLTLGLACVSATRRAAGVGAGLLFAGAVLTAQSAFVGVYQMVSPRLGNLNVLATPAGWGLRLAGATSRVGPEGLLLDNGMQTITFGRSADLFALFALGLFAVGSVVLLVRCQPRSWRPFVLTLGVVAAFVVIRFIVLALMFSVSDRLDLFWTPWLTAVSLLTLPFVLGALVRPDLRYDMFPPGLPLRDWRFWVATASVAFSVFTLIALIGFHDPGVPKQGRVIMNETHSDWEWSTQAYDTSWFGEKSGYNYYSLYQYLDLFYDLERNTGAIDDEMLADCDVLILKPVTEPFAPEEIASIKRFVQGGGGLFLIGDHTNVFGSSTNMNPLAGEFGLHFNHDATYELTKGHLSEYEPPALFPHPIAQHLPLFLFATSCSMRITPRADAVINGYGLKALPADYSQKNFFPAIPNAPDMRFGLMTQAAAVPFGQGRVAAFSDSTVFSNFWMFMPGKPELALSYIEWLNRTNSAFGAAWIPLVFALALAVPFLAVRPRLPKESVLWALCLGALLAVPVATRVYPLVDRASYPLPAARSDFVDVSFEQEHSDYYLPTDLKGFYKSGPKSLDTFFVWNQRLGYVPSVEDTLDQALDTGDVVVVANPTKTPTRESMASIETFVKGGGRLLVLGDVKSSRAANAILKPFGLAIERPTEESGRSVEATAGTLLPLTTSAGLVSGGTPLLLDTSGKSVASFTRTGDGVVAVCSDIALFFDNSMGGVSSVPNERQRAIAQLEFSLMRFLAENEPFGF